MRKPTFFLLAFLVLGIHTAYSQMTDYYVPITYRNPILKSGQFMTNLYYSRTMSTTTHQGDESENMSYNFNLVGYIGITNWLTFSSRLVFYPEQTMAKYTGSQIGEDTKKQAFNPEFTLSFRPVNYLEIFGSLSLVKDNMAFGEKMVPGYEDPVTGIPFPDHTIPGYDIKSSGSSMIFG